MQDGKPIEYFSEKLSPTRQRWSTYAQELFTLQAELTGFDSLREQYIHDENFQIWWDKCSVNDDTGNFIYMMVFC